MGNPHKSVWDDFLVFFGIRPIKFPVVANGSLARVGHPHACLGAFSEDDIKAIESDAQSMRSIVDLIQ